MSQIETSAPVVIAVAITGSVPRKACLLYTI